MNNNDDEVLVKKNLGKSKMPINSDIELLYKSDTSSLSEHNKQYTKLLKAYINYYKHNFKNKRDSQKILFKIAKGLLLGVPICTFLFLFLTLFFLAFGKIGVLESLPGLITALVSLIGTFMIVPQMITEYLFDKEEEKHLADIISKIQEYDRDIRESM